MEPDLDELRAQIAIAERLQPPLVCVRRAAPYWSRRLPMEAVMVNLDLVLTVAALIPFTLAAANVSSPRVGLMAAGLALLTLTLLV